MDPAGNVSGPSSVFAQVDVTPPLDPTIDSPVLNEQVSNPTEITGICEP